MTDIVIDTSAVIAVITDAPEKPELIRLTLDATLVAPPSVHWELGNAFSAMLRRGRISRELATRAIHVYKTIPIRFVDIDLEASLTIAAEHRLYAYDAYLIECSLIMHAPLLTLDGSLARVANTIGVDVVEVS